MWYELLVLCDGVVFVFFIFFFFLIIRRPPRSTQSRSSAASDVYKRQTLFDGSAVHLDRGEPRTEITIRAIPKDEWPDHLTKRKKPKEMKSKYKHVEWDVDEAGVCIPKTKRQTVKTKPKNRQVRKLSLIHISEPTRPY